MNTPSANMENKTPELLAVIGQFRVLVPQGRTGGRVPDTASEYDEPPQKSITIGRVLGYDHARRVWLVECEEFEELHEIQQHRQGWEYLRGLDGFDDAAIRQWLKQGELFKSHNGTTPWRRRTQGGQVSAPAPSVLDLIHAYVAIRGDGAKQEKKDAAYDAMRRSVDALYAELSRRQADSARLDYLEKRAVEGQHTEVGFTEAWTESGDYGSVLSSGPREFWLSDMGTENGPTLRAAIDAAMSAEHKEGK